MRIMDVKCPGSGESHRNDWTNMDRLAAADEVKFVIKDRADYEFARDVVDQVRACQSRALRCISRRCTA